MSTLPRTIRVADNATPRYQITMPDLRVPLPTPTTAAGIDSRGRLSETHAMDALLNKFVAQLQKSQQHLNYSFLKVQKLPMLTDATPDDEMETWESFAARFARTSDLYISRVLRRVILTKDPAFRGSVIDLLNQAEKFAWIESAEVWRRIRALRNVAAHEYVMDDLQALYSELIRLTPFILKVSIGEKA